MNRKRFQLVNRTEFNTSDIEEIANALLEGHPVPHFYLICQTTRHDGLTITNIEKPIIIITIKDLGQFADVFVHEVVHLKQHSMEYASEDFDVDLVVTDSYKKKASND
ncbi:hypothetical protein KKC87_04480 [Patescibacteria group bacterium]|nr:hypothetical protein [Patescibacteria group bacterium]